MNDHICRGGAATTTDPDTVRPSHFAVAPRSGRWMGFRATLAGRQPRV